MGPAGGLKRTPMKSARPGGVANCFGALASLPAYPMAPMAPENIIYVVYNKKHVHEALASQTEFVRCMYKKTWGFKNGGKNRTLPTLR